MKEIEAASESIESSRYGDAITLVGGHFAPGFGNADLIDMAQNMGLDESNIDSAKKAIAATGFTRRYFYNSPTEEKNPGALLERTTEIGSALLDRLLKEKKWQDGIDLFIDTSAFLPTEINHRVLSKSGLSLPSTESKSYRYACAGAVGAIIDVLSDENYKDARVVIGAMEPLSYLLSPDQFLDPQKIAFPSIFGDAYTFAAIEPKKFKLFNKQILIQPDGGVIKLETMYPAKSDVSSETLPSHYKFKNGGEKIFSFDKNGAILQIETPDFPSKVSMDGMATGFFFGDQTTALLIELIEEYGDKDILKSLGGQNLIMHSASKPVVDRIAKLLRRSSYKYLDEPNLPFLMDVAGYSNGSSATTLNRLRYMIDNNLLNPNLPVVWLAPGIGSAIAGAIGAINP